MSATRRSAENVELRSNRLRLVQHTPAASTWAYFAAFIRHPTRTCAQLLGDPARLRYGFLAVLTVGLGYAVTIAGISWSGGTPNPPPWVAIPPAEYFKWEALFVAPLTVLCWVLAGGVMHLLSKPFGGRGTYDDTLALLGFAVALATFIPLIPDAIRALLTSVGVVNRAAWEASVNQPGTADFWFLWAYMIAYVLALLCLFPVSVAWSQRLRSWPAIAVGITGAMVYQGVYFIFIR
jgi:Yip1 domain